MNCLIFIFSGFAVFSLLGHMAYVTNKYVGVVTSSGAGFAFVASPDGISRLPASPVWVFLFFLLLTLGVDSRFAMVETVVSAIPGRFATLLHGRGAPFALLVCGIGFLSGVPLCTEGGRRVVTLMNDCSGGGDLMIIALFGIIALYYVYGIKSFRADIEMMMAAKSNVWGGYWLPGYFLTEQISSW